MLPACDMQSDSAAGGYHDGKKTELKVELTEQLFAQDTDNEVSPLFILAYYNYSTYVPVFSVQP